MLTVGVPFMYRQDMLQRFLESSERCDPKPDRYVIVDNGRGLGRPAWLPSSAEIVTPERNLGVACTWNMLIERFGSVLLANDDMEVRAPDTYGRMLDAFERSGRLLVCGFSFGFFMQGTPLVERIGWYDEAFYPAYLEDVEYQHRMKLAGIPIVFERVDVHHEGSATLKTAGPELKHVLVSGHRRGLQYYKWKWGAHPYRERWKMPFDGDPPIGWSERSPVSMPRAPHLIYTLCYRGYGGRGRFPWSKRRTRAR